MNPRTGAASDLAALSPWARELARTFVSLSSDIALVLDTDGVITGVEQAGEPMAPGAADWVGRRWADTVTGDTRRKIELLLQEVTDGGLARRREVNHPNAGGHDIPVAYTAIRLGPHGPLLAVGRDLRAIAAIQQRFLDAQQELERGYWRARQTEVRDSLLRQVAQDMVLVLDAPSLAIVAANAAAVRRLGLPQPLPAATRLEDAFEPHARGAVGELLVAARGHGRPVEIRARLAGMPAPTAVSATPFRSGDQQRLLVRLRSPANVEAALEREATALAVVDGSGRLLHCDAACAELFGAVVGSALEGRSIGDWLGESPAALRGLLGEVQRLGVVEREAMVLRLGDGRRLQVRLGANWLPDADQDCIGIVIRPPADRAAPPMLADVATAWEMICRELGQVPLRTLVREAAEAAERAFIETALLRCGGNARAAAAMLGISPDALSRRRRRLKFSRGRGEGSRT